MNVMNRRDFLGLLGAGAAWAVLPGGCSKKIDSAEELFKQTKPTNLKVLVIGIDGSTLDIIEPIVKAGKLGQFKKLMDAGTYAKLRSQKPMLSPALWTTIATGHNRDRHNVTFFLSSDRYGNQTSSLVSSDDRKTLALWNIVSAFKKTVGVDGWWVTWPAEMIGGYMVSDRVAHTRWGAWTDSRSNERLVFPAEMLERIRPLIVDPTNPPMDEIERLVELTEAERNEMLAAKRPIAAHGLSVSKFGYCTQRTYESIALNMLESGQPDLNMIFLIAVDPICHTFWHCYHPEQFPKGIDPDKANRLGKFIPAIYEHNDSYLSKLLPQIDSNTVILIVSDHGVQASGQLPGLTNVADYRRFGINRIEKLDRNLRISFFAS